MTLKKIILYAVIFLFAGSCIPEGKSLPYKNVTPYAFEIIKKKKVVGVGQMMFLIEDESGFIIYNRFSLNQAGGKTPVESVTELIEVAQLQEKSSGLYIVIGKHFRGYPVVGTLRRGASGFPYLDDIHHLDFQITIQKKPSYFLRPLSDQGMVFYQAYLTGLDLGQSVDFTKYKYSD